MRKVLKFITVFSLLSLANLAFARPGHNGPGPGNPGDGGFEGGFSRGQVIYNPTIRGYVLMASANAEANARQFCMENRYRGGRVLNLQWIVRAPAADFNGWGWQFYPQADNYQGIAAVECFGGGGGGGNGYPDTIFQRPLINGYPLFANEETANAYCQQQRYRRGQVQQSLYVDTNPAYGYAYGAWQFYPRADHYQMIDVLACYRW